MADRQFVILAAGTLANHNGATAISQVLSLRVALATVAKNGNRFSSYIMGIVKSPAFQMSKAEPLTTEAANKN